MPVVNDAPQPVILIQSVGVLVDGTKWREQSQHNTASFMARRYGQSGSFWRTINQRLVADWANYHADLNFSGDEGIADMHEAQFRLVRALFRLAQLPEPSKPQITALAREIAAIPCDDRVLLPDARPILATLRERGYTIATFGYLLAAQLQAMCAALPIMTAHIGADTVNHYDHDATYFAKVADHLKASPDCITVITSDARTAATASSSGLMTSLVRQSSASLEYDLHALLGRE